MAFIAIAAVLFGKHVWRWYADNLVVNAPEFSTPTRTTWLKQNWSPNEGSWFHHADQGTQTFGMPYEWFVALDRPQIFFNGTGRLSDPVYLDRFGFIPDSQAPGAVKLPVGFAHGAAVIRPDGGLWPNPQTRRPFTGVGLTCAGCHTGRITYHGQEMLLDGGSALTNLGELRHAIGVSLLVTRWVPGRLDQFDARVLGPNASTAAKSALNAQLDAALDGGKRELGWSDTVKLKNVEEGFGRLDALNRIGNTVFAIDMDQQANYAAISAPVHFPRIWDAPWFLWVQYNGSIEQPMVRNAGEALGLVAHLQVAGPNMFQSSVRVDELYILEKQLAGLPPSASSGFTGLRAPRWSETPLPPINATLAQQGAALYATHCQSCHLAPTTTPEFWASPQWMPANAAGERYLDVTMTDIEQVGTDPAQAAGMAARTVEAPAGIGIKERSFGRALGALVEKVATRWYDAQTPPTLQADRYRMNGNRPNGIRALLAYKARPLDEIWATPPYLHNGAVPNLDALLSPVAKRPQKFYLGNREYDPDHVGYKTESFKNGFLFDAQIPGNSNAGHEFSDIKGPGVIGPFLKDDERRALIEYLKTL